MGNADRRNSRKMLRRRSQTGLQNRIVRRKEEATALRRAGKKVKPAMFPPAPPKPKVEAPKVEAPKVEATEAVETPTEE